MPLSSTDRERLIALLEAAKLEQNRCMGGVDPDGCVLASKRVIELRGMLRDDAAIVAHFGKVLAIAPRSKRRRRSS